MPEHIWTEPKTQLSGSSLGIGLLAEFFWEELGLDECMMTEGEFEKVKEEETLR